MKNKFIQYLVAACCMLAITYSPNLMGQCSPTLTADPSCDGLAVTNYDNIVIGEVSGDAGQSDGCNDGIVEIVGPPGFNIGCMVVTNTEWAVLIPPNTPIPGDGVYLIACSSDPTANCGVGINGTSNGLVADGTEGDFNPDLTTAEIDLDVCDPTNGAFYDPAATGFTIDNSSATDGDQVMMFLPDGTPWDGIYWGTAGTSASSGSASCPGPGGAATVGGASGAADAVVVQIAGQTYTLGDNDQNGVVNDNAGSFYFADGTSGRGDRGTMCGATMVPVLPTHPDCPCNTPDAPGTYTVPSLSDANFWFDMNGNSATYKGCNSSYIRLDPGTSQGGANGSPSHADGSYTDQPTDANGNPTAVGTTTMESFTAGGYTPSSCGDPTAEWSYTDHPNPGQANDVPAFTFYVENAVQCESDNLDVVVTVEVYNYQNVSDDTDTGSGVDNNQLGSYIEDPFTGNNESWMSYAVAGDQTTMTYTIPAATLTGAGAGDYNLTAVWDDFSNCCGSSTSAGNECYESFDFVISLVEDMVASDLAISCQAPNDEDASPGTINFSDFMSGGSDLSYTLLDNGAPVDGPNDSGVFAILGTYAGPLTVEVTDASACTDPITITIDNDCRLAPPCPSIDTSVEDDVDDLLCPGDQVCFDLTGTDLPEGGTIDFYYDTTTGFDPYAGEGTYLGSATINAPSGDPNWTITGFTSTGNGSSIGVSGNDGNGTWTNQSGGGGANNTPGAANDGSGNYTGSSVVINEVLYDGPSNCDGGNLSAGATGPGEFIEIAGPPGTDIGCYQVTDGDWTVTIPFGTVIPADGFYLIGNGAASCAPGGIDLDLSDSASCNSCFSNGNTGNFTFTNASSSNGEYVGIFDSSGTFLDGVSWGGPGDTSGNSPCAGTQSTDPSTAGGCSASSVPIPQADTCSNIAGGGPEQFCTTFDENFCNLSATGDFFITGIINPFIENNTVEPFCLSSDADKSTNEFMFNMSCPDATLVPDAFDVCIGDQASVDVTVNITGGVGPYTVEWAIDGTSQGTVSIADGGVINVPGPTDGEIKVTLLSITDQGGGLCSGTVGPEEACINIRPSVDLTITGASQPNDCEPCDGTITFNLSAGTSTNSFDIDYTVNGTPFTVSSVSMPYTLIGACPGTYEIVGATDDAGCPMTVTANEQILAAPGGPTLVVSAQPSDVCGDGTATVDLATDVTYAPGYTPADFTFFTVDPNSLPASALTNSPPLLTSTVVTVTGATTYYALYTDPVTGCETTAVINITVDNALCAVPCPIIGALASTAPVCDGDPFDLTATGLDDMAQADNNETDFGIDFVHFGADVALPADPYTGGTSLGTVAFGALTGTDPAQEAALSGATLAAGTYQVCAILTPTSADADCRPSACTEVVIFALPAAPTVNNVEVCEGGDTTITPDQGDPPAAFTATWDFEGEVVTGTADNAGITVSDASLGAGVGSATFPNGTGGTGTDAYSTNNWTQPDEASAIANDDYFEFCITATTTATITDFSFFDDVSGTGPTNYSILISTDGFATSTNVGTGTTNGSFQAAPNTGSFSVTLTAGQTLCARIYAYGNGAGDTGGTMRIDDVSFTGTVGASSTFNFYSDAALTTLEAGPATSYDPGTTTATSPESVWVTTVDANGCESAPVEVTVTVNANPTLAAASVCVGSTVAMVGSGTAAAATPYVSDDTAVATVDDAGTVTGVAAGTANITYTDDNGCSVTAVVTVNANPTLDAAAVCVGQTILMTFTGTPGSFSSDDTGVATVDASGNVTGVAAGTANITFTDANTCSVTAVVTVTLLDITAFTFADYCAGTTGNLPDLTGATTGGTFSFNPDPGDGATINTTTGEITGGIAGTTYTVNYATTGACASNNDAAVTVLANPTLNAAEVCIGSTVAMVGSGTAAAATPYVSDDTAVATVDDAGTVTGVAAGTANITYTDDNGCSVTAVVTVNADPTLAAASVCVGATTTMTGSGTAAAATPYVSDDASVATVDDAGTVTGVAAGTANITYTDDNGCSVAAVITVNGAPTLAAASVCIGATTTMTGSGTAAAATPYVSDDTTIATVADDGTVTGVAAGTANITYTDDNGCSVMAIVTVNADPTLDPVSVCVGQMTTITGSGTAAAVDPYTSSDTAIATVDASGSVTGVAVGSAMITYTDDNGCSVMAAVTVTLVDDASFTLDEFCIGATNAATITGVTGGTFAFNPAPADAATIDATTGAISNATAGVTYTVEYTTGGDCSNSSTQAVTPVACAPVLDVCNCDGSAGDLFVISEPGTYNDDVDHNHIYILVDADGNVVTTSTDGNFAGVATGAYEVYAFNYALSTEGALPDYSAGMPISNLTDPATFDGTDTWNSIDPCYEVKGPAVANVNQCIPTLAAVSNPELCAGLDMIDLGDYTPAVEPAGISGAGQWYTGADNTGTMVSGMQMVADGDQFYYEYISDEGCPASATITVTAVDFDPPAAIDPISICSGDGSTLITPEGGGQLAMDLFISEYVEGSGFNKCVEIYNATGATVNLSNYWIDIYTNGGGTPNGSSPFALVGTLADGATHVVCSDNQDLGADFAAVADQLIGLNFNGDDGVALVNNGTVIDVVGNLGATCDPGSQWSDGANSTQNETIVRNACVSSGAVANGGDCSFSTLGSEWTALGQDVATNLGVHTSVQYNFYSDAALTDLLAGPTDSYDPGASGTYYVTAACDGCQSEAVEVTISVNDIPVLEAITDPEICDDGSETLTFSTLNPTVTTGDATGTYTWYADNGFGGPDTSSELTSTTIGGTYWVVYTDGTDTACSTQTSISVTTAPCVGPCDGFSVAMAMNIDECEGASTTDLTITPTGGGTTDNAATAYNFYADDMGAQGAFIVSGASYAPTVAAGSSVTIWVTAISGTPCESSAIPVTVSVEAAASATVTATANICNTTEGGNTASIDLSTLVTAGDMTGTWTLDTDPMTAITSFSGVDNGAGTYNLTYTLAAADGSACDDVTYPAVITVDDCVSVCPTPSLVSGISGDRCDDDLSISAEIGLTNDAFLTTTTVQWFLDGVAIDGETALTYSGSVQAPSCGSASYTLSAVVTCDAVGANPVTLDAGTITVYSTPVAGTDFTEPTLECNTALVNVCAGATVTYTVNGDPVVGTLENLNLGDADATIGYTVSIPGAPDGCEATGSYNVNCPPAPECPIITIPEGSGITEACGDDVGYFGEIELLGGNVNASIEWFVNGVSVGTGSTYSATFEELGGSCGASINIITAEVLCDTDEFPTTVDVGSVTLYSAPIAGVDFFEPTEECTATLDLGDCEIATVNYTVNGEAIAGTPVNVVDGDVIGYTVSLGSADECSVSGEYTYNCLVQECPIVNVLESEDTDLCDDGTGSAEITGSVQLIGGLNTNTTVEWLLNGETISGVTGTSVVVLLSPPSDPCSPSVYDLTAVATCDLDGSTTLLDVSTVTLYPTPFAGVQFDEPTADCQVALIENCDNLTVTYTINGEIADPSELAEGESATVEYEVSGDNGCSATGSYDVACPAFNCDVATLDSPITSDLCAGDDLSIAANISLAGGENSTSTVEWFLNGASAGTGESFSGMAMASTDNCSATTSNLTAVVTCDLDGSTTEIDAGTVTVYGIPQESVDYTLPDNCNAALAVVCDGVNVSYSVNGEAISDVPSGLSDGDEVTYAIGIDGAPDGCAAVGAYTYNCPVDCPTINLDGDTPSNITICSGESVTAGVVFENATEDQIVWNTGDTGSTLDLGVLTNDSCDSQSFYYSATIAGDGDTCPLVVAGFTVTILPDPSNQADISVNEEECTVNVTACDGFQIQYAVDGGDMQNGDSYSLDAGEDEILNASVQFSITSPECDTYETEITSLVCVGPPSPPNPCLNNNVELFEDCDIESGILTITGVISGGEAPYQITGTGGIDYTAYQEDAFVVNLSFDEWDGIVEYTVTDSDGCTQVVSLSPGSCEPTVPVELLVFTGDVTEEGNNLMWITATEINVSHFDLMRSVDGVNFERIADVTAVGNSTLTNNYDYLDKDAPEGTSYYRLETIDNDGSMAQSEVIALTRGAMNLNILSIAPVPVEDVLQLNFQAINEVTIEISIYDVTGRTVMTRSINPSNGLNTIDIEMSAYAAGAYIIQLTNGETEQSRKFIKK